MLKLRNDNMTIVIKLASEKMIINTNYIVNNACGNIVIMEHATLHAYVTILHSALISVTPILLGN